MSMQRVSAASGLFDASRSPKRHTDFLDIRWCIMPSVVRVCVCCACGRRAGVRGAQLVCVGECVSVCVFGACVSRACVCACVSGVLFCVRACVCVCVSACG